MSNLEVKNSKKLSVLSQKLPTLNYSQLGVKYEKAKVVIEGYLSPIRDIPKEQIPKAVGGIISICATMYCGMQSERMLAETIQESVRFVYKNYPQLGVNEIREAFSLAAANVFSGVNMTAFFGTFTISMLGDILTAYSDYRNPIISKAYDQIIKLEQETKQETERGEKNALALNKIQQDIERAIIAVQSGEADLWESWHDVPVHYAEIAVREQWIEVSPEFKKSIWEESKKLALRELGEMAADLSNFSQAKQAKIKLTDAIEKKTVPDAALRIYSKLLIFKYVKMHEV
jgi:hypothetical protein